ncbi:MAG: hypothetical protein ACM3TR_06425 [Caulobacteraceae bacterium]
MPKKVDHDNQYKSNKALLKTSTFDLTSTKHYDWVITIVFYCAVHLIEMELDGCKNYDSIDHYDRKLQILSTKSLRPISKIYLALYIESMRARYKCENITRDDAEKALRTLVSIEKAVC